MMVMQYAKRHRWGNPARWPRWVQDSVLVLMLVASFAWAWNQAYDRATQAHNQVSAQAKEADQRFCEALPFVISEALNTFDELSAAQKAETTLRVDRALQERGACPVRSDR